jgi:hypothetical protein
VTEIEKKLDEMRSRVVNYEEDIHIMPMSDIIEHFSDANCDCRPFIDPTNRRETGLGRARNTVWIHHMIAAGEGKQ